MVGSLDASRKKFGNTPKRLAISFSSCVFIGDLPEENLPANRSRYIPPLLGPFQRMARVN